MRTAEDALQKYPSSVSRRRADTERLEAQLAEWTAIIAQYRASAKRAGEDSRLEFDRIADDLQLLRNQAGAQIMLLKGVMDFEWENSVSNLDRSWSRIRPTFQQAMAKF